jgi:hypothetical protein
MSLGAARNLVGAKLRDKKFSLECVVLCLRIFTARAALTLKKKYTGKVTKNIMETASCKLQSRLFTQQICIAGVYTLLLAGASLSCRSALCE